MTSPATNEAAVSLSDAAAHLVNNYEQQLLDAALSYASRGWPVFPCFWIINDRCACGNIDCPSPGKHPLIQGGFLNAMTDQEVLKAWWQKYPLANIGIPTGETSGFDVVDVDDKDGLPALVRLAGCKLKSLPRQRSGRADGGWHFLFRHPLGIHVKSGAKFLPGMDSRGDGGYIVVAPSMHVSGRCYKWLYLPENDRFPELPKALLEAISGPTSNGNGEREKFDSSVVWEGIPDGQRDNELFRYACQMRSFNAPREVADRLILEAAALCRPPFPDHDALKKVEQAYKYPAGHSNGTANGNGTSVHLTPYPKPTLEEGVMCHDIESAEIESGAMAFPNAAWSGLFGRWRDIAAPCTEAPLESLWGAFLLTVGLMLGRNVWRSSPRPLYPNFYLLLIGQTGDSRKSTVIWLAEELLQRIGADVEIIKGIVSTEGLLEALAKKDETRALGYADEFRSILSVARRKGTQDIIPRLQSLHSCPYQDTVTRREKSTTAVKPFLSFITATPQAFIEDLLGELEITGGFLNRFLIVTGEVQDPKPMVKPPSEVAWQSIVRPLSEIRDRIVENPHHMEFDPEAEQLWIDFYTQWRTKRKICNPRTADLSARTFEHVLKIAVVYSVLAGEWMISPKSLATAIALGGWLERNTLTIFGETGLDRRSKAQNAIIKRLKRAKGGLMYVRDLQRNLSGIGITGSDFRDGLKILADNDHLKVYEIHILSGQKRKVVELIPLDTRQHSSTNTREKVSGV